MGCTDSSVPEPEQQKPNIEQLKIKMPSPKLPKIIQGVTCTKGDFLQLKTAPRPATEYEGVPSFLCNLCMKSAECADGYYACTDASCEFDCCINCFKGEKKVVKGVTCRKGDMLRLRMPQTTDGGEKTFACGLCQKEQSVDYGVYKCADVKCNQNVCSGCFKGEKCFVLGSTCTEGNMLAIRTVARASSRNKSSI